MYLADQSQYGWCHGQGLWLLCLWIIFWKQGLVESDGSSVRKRGKNIFPNRLANLLRKASKQVHQSMEIKAWKKSGETG